MPMKMPSMAAYTSTSAGLITRRNATTSTTTKPTRPDRISAGSISVSGMANQASAAVRISTAMVMAVLVTTSSKVIRPSGASTGAWPGYCGWPGYWG